MPDFHPWSSTNWQALRLYAADCLANWGRSEEEKEPLAEGERGEWKGLKLNIQKTKSMASGPTTSWQIEGEKVEALIDFIFLGSKITEGGDCRHEIKRYLLLGRKVMTNLHSTLLLLTCQKVKDYSSSSSSVVTQACPTLFFFFFFSFFFFMSNSATPWTARLLCRWDSPGKNIGVGCHSLLQGIFLTQGLNTGLPHCRQILYHLSHQASPKEIIVSHKSTQDQG